MITSPATITATEPMVSLTTSRNAARRLRLWSRDPISTHEPDQIRYQPDRTEGQHSLAGNGFRRIDQPADALDEHVDADRQEGSSLHHRRQYLGPLEAPGAPLARRPLRQDSGQVGEAETADVGEHVARIGEERQAAGEDGADHLGDEHGDREHQHDAQPATRQLVRDPWPWLMHPS